MGLIMSIKLKDWKLFGTSIVTILSKAIISMITSIKLITKTKSANALFLTEIFNRLREVTHNSFC